MGRSILRSKIFAKQNLPSTGGGGGGGGYQTATLTAFNNLISTNSLVTGSWYRITGCGPSANLNVWALAIANNQWSRQIILEDLTNGPTFCDATNLSQIFWNYRDGVANDFYRYPDMISGSRPLLNQDYFKNCKITYPTTFSGFTTCNVISSSFAGGNYDVSSSNIISSNFEGGGITNATPRVLNINYSSFKNCIINNDITDSDASLTYVEGLNSIITFQGIDPITISNCRFENVQIVIKDGATVENLTIIGTTDNSSIPIYIIDGVYQGKVLDNWAGHVIADRYRGTSTVRAVLTEDTSADQGTWDTVAKAVYPLISSVIGTYLFPDTDDVFTLYSVSDIHDADTYLYHSLRFKWFDNTALGNTLQFDFVTFATLLSGTEIVTYSGKVAAVGDLISPACFADFRSQLAAPISANVFVLEYGASYS